MPTVASAPGLSTSNHPIDVPTSLRWAVAALLILIAGIGYAIAFATRQGGAAILIALPCIFLLGRMETARRAFYAGAFCGLACYVPHLWFFGAIFGPSAAALWCVAAIPLGILVLLRFRARQYFGPTTAMWLTPIFWTGVEFFRSELYYLKFAWILPGQVVAFTPGLRWLWFGVYGLGFLYALAAALLVGPRPIYRMTGAALLVVFAALMYLPASPPGDSARAPLHVAGVQLEHPSESQAVAALERLAIAHPEAQILVLSEYSLPGPVPDSVRDVVRLHGRYLVAGGIEFERDPQFRDTAFVIGPDGRDVFSQCKSVPVQFMADGLPAADRRVWESPWGRIGIAICYDISYARVMDDFVRRGAQGLIVPTMDLASWGRYEREMLHGRLAPVRAAEYGIPVFGVWSSGESQLTGRYGRVIATAGFPGQGEMIAGPFDLAAAGHVPWDRYPALAASVIAGAFLAWSIGRETVRRVRVRLIPTARFLPSRSSGRLK
jgi:apolipoprotein N-acyltransferase